MFLTTHDMTVADELLREATVHTLHTQEATLEDVFLRVTGHSLQ